MDKKLANAVGGRSIRACDNCIRKRARWYCAADDAFLCQACDSSVHSANPLARRHERVRLKTASIKSVSDESRIKKKSNTTKINPNTPVPSWHRGFTRKARTPRHKTTSKPFFSNPLHLVPGSEDNSYDANEEQLLYRVPVYDPFAAELCNSNEALNNMHSFEHESKTFSNEFSQHNNHFHDSLPSEMDLAEFAADVESLLGKGLEDESFDMKSLGLLDTIEGTGRVKDEDGGIEEVIVNHEIAGELIDIGRETFDLNFNYDSPINCEDDEAVILREPMMMVVNNSVTLVPRNNLKENMILNLDYEGVMSAWDGEKSPWTTGERPALESGDCICWPSCMGTCGTIQFYGDMGPRSGQLASMMGREARVSRYREKRLTRLFSKKIRYEVRKLNAEKRPRMKGRFVKRANLVL